MFACIYVPDFPAQALTRVSPELRDQAIAVLDGTPPLLTVIAANPRARDMGIQVSMTKLHAEACAGLQLLRRSLLQEAAAHDALLDSASSFSPRVEDTQLRTPGSHLPGDTIILDISGLNRLLGSAAKIAHEIFSAVSKMGLIANVAIADNPDAAMHLARGFLGVTVAAPGTEARRLATLPVTLLGAAPAMLETLESWGIHDFGSLAALPEVALSQRLGQEGLRLQKLACGSTRRTLVPAEMPLKFEETFELEDALELLEPLAFLLNRMLEQICARLLARSLAANEMRLALELTGYEDQSAAEQEARKTAYERTFQFPVPMQDCRTFLKLLQLDLAAHPPGGPVKKILLAAKAVPPRFAQSGLFLPQGPAPERLELTLARIRGIVGDERVGSPELLDTHAPEGFRMRSFHSNNSTSKGAKDVTPGSVRGSSRTAMRIFRPPLQTKVQLKQGMPSRLFLHGQRHQVTAAAGPWRRSGGWWTEHGWTRDEWDLELRTNETSPVLVRVYRDLTSAKWFVEGSFD